MKKTDQGNYCFIQMAQKYVEVLNIFASNLSLFNISFPGSKTLLEINQKAYMQILSNPFGIVKSTIEFQIAIAQQANSASNMLELIKLSYTQIQKYYQDLIESLNLPSQDAQYLLFFIKQYLSAVAPENFLLYNIDALNTCAQSNFQNISQGLENLAEDLKNSKYFFSPPNVDKLAFEIGVNIAATAKSIVYKNSIMELICYKPLGQTFATPILIVPPCINKYYILDLSQHNSLVKYLVDNNFQVFVISWTNPVSMQQNFDFQDYISMGVLESCSFIKQNFGYEKISTIGYCIGGTMLAIAIAYVRANKNNPHYDTFGPATFLNTMLDFSSPGEISIFIRQDLFSQLKEISSKCGYLDGIYLYTIFNMLRAKELIWSPYINNYLQGLAPKALDILYWNCDYVNLPAKLFEFYIQNMYIDNKLIQPNGIEILNTLINLKNIDVETFFLATKSDHIVPWQQNYQGMQYLSRAGVFCLSLAGHVAGVINPANSNKYAYFINRDNKNNLDPQSWLAGSYKIEGSWWGYHLDWLRGRSGKLKDSIVLLS